MLILSLGRDFVCFDVCFWCFIVCDCFVVISCVFVVLFGVLFCVSSVRVRLLVGCLELHVLFYCVDVLRVFAFCFGDWSCCVCLFVVVVRLRLCFC